jgi:hypothetical protein
VITNALIDHAALVPLVLVGLVLGCVVLGVLARRDRRALAVLLGTSLLPVAGLTLVPAARPRLDEEFCTVQFGLPGFGSVELLANVALFVPAAVFAVLLSRRPLLVLAAAAGTSAAIEMLQAVVGALQRACDTNDWAMNTAGAGVGVLLGVAVQALPARRGVPSRG